MQHTITQANNTFSLLHEVVCLAITKHGYAVNRHWSLKLSKNKVHKMSSNNAVTTFAIGADPARIQLEIIYKTEALFWFITFTPCQAK